VSEVTIIEVLDRLKAKTEATERELFGEHQPRLPEHIADDIYELHASLLDFEAQHGCPADNPEAWCVWAAERLADSRIKWGDARPDTISTDAHKKARATR
jgi:hypothetical protein